MSKFDGQLDAHLLPDQPLIEAFEQDLLTGSLLNQVFPTLSKRTYLPGTEPSLQQTYHWLLGWLVSSNKTKLQSF
jgi:hypothetical protein